MESTTYALLAGFQNFGTSVSRSAGAFVIEIAGIGQCNFTNLPLAIGVCNMAFPLLCIPLAYVLLPDMRLSESFENVEIQTNLVEDSSWEFQESESEDESKI